MPASPPSSHSLFQHSNDKKSALRQTLPDLCVQAQPPQQQQHHQQREVVKLFVGQIPKTLEEDGVREGMRRNDLNVTLQRIVVAASCGGAICQWQVF